jgi:hypothetical protein
MRQSVSPLSNTKASKPSIFSLKAGQSCPFPTDFSFIQLIHSRSFTFFEHFRSFRSSRYRITQTTLHPVLEYSSISHIITFKMKFSASLLALFPFGFYVLAAPVSPAKRDVIATLDGAVSGLETSVTASVEAIGISDTSQTLTITILFLFLTIHLSLAQVVVSSVETEILPSVESNLGNIKKAVGQATAVIVPVVTGTVVSLTVDEVETLLNDLKTLKTIVLQIESTVSSTIPAVLTGTCPRSTPFPISLCAKLCQARAADVHISNQRRSCD